MAKKKYKSTMRASVRDRAKARDSQGFGLTCLKIPSDVEIFKPSKKVHNLDIIPYVVTDPKHPDRGDDEESGAQVGTLWYSRRYFVHRNVGANRDTYVCPRKTWGQRCPICEYMDARREEGAEKEELAELRPKERQLFNVIDLDEDPDKIKLMDSSYHLFGNQLNKDVLEGDEEYDGFAELEGGYTLKARFEKKSFQKNEFWECDRIDFKPRKSDYDEDIVEDTVPLDDILVKVPYKELEKIFIMGSNEDEEEDEEETPPKKTIRRKSRDEEDERDEDEDEEEDRKSSKKTRRVKSRDEEEDEDDDDEEEEKSRRKKPIKKSSKKVEEDEDEDDDEEEEEEEKPSRKRRKSKPEPEDDDEEEEGDEDDEDDEEEEEKPRNKRSRRSKTRKSNEDDEDEEPAPRRKCPVKGGKFGKNCEDFDECDSCKLWQACSEASNE